MVGTRTITTALSSLGGQLSKLLKYGTQPPHGRLYVPDPSLDGYRSYVSDRLTFARLKTLVRSGDSGDIASLLALFEEMEAKDPHLQGVANTRRNALTGLEWDVVSAAESATTSIDKTLADEAAAYVQETLTNVAGFDETLEHLATAIGPNLAVAELVWESFKLSELTPLPSHRLTLDPRDLAEVRVITADQRLGVVATAPKFVVHIPHSRAGFPFACTISQAQAIIYLIKHLATADWASFVEIFGQPVRWGTYRPGATKAEKDEALAMFKNMGSAAYALFSEAVEAKLVESSQRGTSPHKDLVDWCERKQSIAYLGQHMTTDTSGSTGTYSAASVQEQVRQDLLEDDVRREARTIRRDVIVPLVTYKFAGRQVPLPTFRRNFRENVDRKLEAEVIAAAQAAGVNVPKDWAHERLAIPKPKPDEETLEPVNVSPFAEEGTL